MTTPRAPRLPRVSGAIRRLVVAVVVAVAGVAAVWWATPQPEAAAIGAGDAIGEYVVRLRGDAFERNESSGRVSEGTIRGRAVVRVTRTTADGDPHDLTVEVALESALRGGLLDRATPTPTLRGRGVLVGDSLTAISVGQTNFVNAMTLHFVKNGKKIDGMWIASFPGSDARNGFVAGAGVSFKGKRLRPNQIAPAVTAVRFTAR